MTMKLNPITGQLDLISVEDLSGYLTLDQTTAQTITNGIPIFDELTASKLVLTDSNKKLVSSSYTDTAFVKKADTHSISFVLDTPTAADTFPIWQAPYAVTVTAVTGTVLGGTSVTMNVENRTSLGSAGNDICSSDFAATTTGASGTINTSYDNVASGSFLVFTSSALSGTVNQIVVKINFTID